MVNWLSLHHPYPSLLLLKKKKKKKKKKTKSKREKVRRRLMDFSELNEALASKSYGRIADICDNLMLQVASTQGDTSYQDDWPYSLHLLGHIYSNDVNSARFLWKSIPSSVKERQAEVVAVWKIGQQLWSRNYSGVYDAIRGFDWSPDAQGLVSSFSELYTERMFRLLVSAYSTIGIGEAAHFLGMNEEDATNYAVGQGWIVDPTSRMLTVKKKAIATEQKLDHTKLQRLTEYVFHLEH